MVSFPFKKKKVNVSRKGMPNMGNELGLKQLPLGLLNAAQGHPMLVELKSGETLNGHLVLCDTWMNLTLREVVQTSPVRNTNAPNKNYEYVGGERGVSLEADSSWGLFLGWRQVCAIARGLCQGE